MDEPELDELPPPPDELLDDELRDDEDEPPDEDELEDEAELEELEELEVELELELELDEIDDELDEVDELDDVDEDDPSGPVGRPWSHPTASIPAPARATPPDNSFKNSRRSSRRLSDDFTGGPSELPIQPPCRPGWSKPRAAGQRGGSAPPS